MRKGGPRMSRARLSKKAVAVAAVAIASPVVAIASPIALAQPAGAAGVTPQAQDLKAWHITTADGVGHDCVVEILYTRTGDLSSQPPPHVDIGVNVLGDAACTKAQAYVGAQYLDANSNVVTVPLQTDGGPSVQRSYDGTPVARTVVPDHSSPVLDARVVFTAPCASNCVTDPVLMYSGPK